MEDNTNRIIQFIQSNTTMNKAINTASLLEKSSSMISTIISHMETAVKSWNNINIDSHILDMISESPHNFPKGNNYNYIVEEIKMQFESASKIGKKYTFSIGSRKFNINMIKPLKNIQCSQQEGRKTYKTFDKMFRKMYVWLFVACSYANTICSPELDIYIYLTEYKKVLPEFNNETLLAIHANTAFTMACPIRSNEIYIFREEEWFKVFVHETFHSLGLDFAQIPEETTEKQMFSIFPIKCDLRLYEAYTEFWAEIINIIFISVNTTVCKNTSDIDIKQVIQKIEGHIHNEQVFSLFQCVKVLHHYGIKYRELYEKTERSQHIRLMRYKEETQIFSYYIIKSILIYYYSDFIEWCCIHNNMSIQFANEQTNINEFIKFIKKRYNSEEYSKTIHIFEYMFSKYFKINSGKIEFETMRMSITE
jgi:hypothetical protein